jgi:hypothetical protein
MKDNTQVIAELMDLTQTPEQVIFLKELDANLIVSREEYRRELEAELRVTKSVYKNVIDTIVGNLTRGY